MTSVTHEQVGAQALDPLAPAPSRKLSLGPLVGLVVGSTIGGGVFNLPGDMSRHASPGAIMIGWAITGVGRPASSFWVRIPVESSETST